MRQAVVRVFVAVVAGVSLVAAAGSWGAAQDTAPIAHPSHIHAGTCAELDPNPTWPLADVAPVTPDAPAGAVELGQTTIETTLDDLLASPFALNVHASAEDIATYIACGDIAGPVVDGTLIVPLRTLNDSGFEGVAVLSTAGAETAVTVYLTVSLVDSTVATPAGAVAISIIDFGFDAEKVEIPVGTTVTWTNTGQVIHTTTSKDGLWDSAIMNTGDTFSYTFDEAGTFEYWCTLHPNMLGTIVVS
jgi:plastocyanin